MKTILLCLVAYFGAISGTFAEKTNHTQNNLGYKIWVQNAPEREMEKSIVFAEDLKEWTETNISWLNEIPEFFDNYTGGVSSKCMYVYFESGKISVRKNGKLRFKKLSQKQIKEIYPNPCINNVNCLPLIKN